MKANIKGRSFFNIQPLMPRIWLAMIEYLTAQIKNTYIDNIIILSSHCTAYLYWEVNVGDVKFKHPDFSYLKAKG